MAGHLMNLDLRQMLWLIATLASHTITTTAAQWATQPASLLLLLLLPADPLTTRADHVSLTPAPHPHLACSHCPIAPA